MKLFRVIEICVDVGLKLSLAGLAVCLTGLAVSVLTVPPITKVVLWIALPLAGVAVTLAFYRSFRRDIADIKQVLRG